MRQARCMASSLEHKSITLNRPPPSLHLQNNSNQDDYLLREVTATEMGLDPASCAVLCWRNSQSDNIVHVPTSQAGWSMNRYLSDHLKEAVIQSFPAGTVLSAWKATRTLCEHRPYNASSVAWRSSAYPRPQDQKPSLRNGIVTRRRK